MDEYSCMRTHVNGCRRKYMDGHAYSGLGEFCMPLLHSRATVSSVQCPVSPSLGLSMAARWRNVLERLLAQMNERLDLAEVVLGLVARWAVAEDRSTTIRVIGVLRLARRDRARWLSASTLEAMARVGRDD